MTKRLWVWAGVCLLLLAGTVAAQCVSTLQPVSQPAAFPNHEAGPMAWNGAVFGVVKIDPNPFAHELFFAIYDQNLHQVAPDVSIAPQSLPDQVEVLWNGSEFVVFYLTPGFQILMQRISGNGTANGLPVTVGGAHGNLAGEQFDVKWDPTRRIYVLLYSIQQGFDRGLWLAAIGTDGSTKSDVEQTFVVTDPVSPRISITSGGVIAIVWSRSISGNQELALSLATPGAVTISPVTIAKNASLPQIATDDHSFFLVYTVPSGSNTSDLHTQRFDLTLKVIAPDTKLVAGSGIDIAAASVIPNPTLGEWAVLYVDTPQGVTSGFPGITRLRRIPYAAGYPQSDTYFSPDVTKIRLQPLSALQWDGRSYDASIGRTLSVVEGTESYLARHCPLTVQTNAASVLTNPNVPLKFDAFVNGGSGPYSVTWDFGDLSSPQSGTEVTHTFDRTGTYTVTVTTTDVQGAIAVAKVTVVVAHLKHRAAGK